MAVKSSSIFPGFISYLPREQKKLNTIPKAAVARLLPRAFLWCWGPFPEVNKGFGHHFCSPELPHGHCGISLLVVSNSPSVITQSMLGSAHATLTTSKVPQRQDSSSVCMATKTVPCGYAEPQCPHKSLESLTTHVQRNICSGAGLSKHRRVHWRSAREKPKMPHYCSALPGSWNQGDPL